MQQSPTVDCLSIGRGSGRLSAQNLQLQITLLYSEFSLEETSDIISQASCAGFCAWNVCGSYAYPALPVRSWKCPIHPHDFVRNGAIRNQLPYRYYETWTQNWHLVFHLQTSEQSVSHYYVRSPSFWQEARSYLCELTIRKPLYISNYWMSFGLMLDCTKCPIRRFSWIVWTSPWRSLCRYPKVCGVGCVVFDSVLKDRETVECKFPVTCRLLEFACLWSGVRLCGLGTEFIGRSHAVLGFPLFNLWL